MATAAAAGPRLERAAEALLLLLRCSWQAAASTRRHEPRCWRRWPGGWLRTHLQLKVCQCVDVTHRVYVGRCVVCI
jgi:hypothetical protein